MSEEKILTDEEKKKIDEEKLKDPYKNNPMFDPKIIYRETEEAPILEDFEFDIDGESIEHIKNNKLRKKGAKIAYTEEHIKEIIKCKNDIQYFADNYFYIRSLDHGMIKIKLRPYQRQLVSNLNENRFNIVNASRQSGKCFYDGIITIKNNLGEVSSLKIDCFYKKLDNKNFIRRSFNGIKYNFYYQLNRIVKKLV